MDLLRKMPVFTRLLISVFGQIGDLTRCQGPKISECCIYVHTCANTHMCKHICTPGKTDGEVYGGATLLLNNSNFPSGIWLKRLDLLQCLETWCSYSVWKKLRNCPVRTCPSSTSGSAIYQLVVWCVCTVSSVVSYSL